MDFHSMKRKELQALCKKHGIPANLTNREMANKLSLLLKQNKNPITRGRSCLKNSSEIAHEIEKDCKDVTRKVKKVRFSPENEMIEFVALEMDPVQENPVVMTRAARRRSMLKPALMKVGAVDENADNIEPLGEIIGNPVRMTRSRAQNSMEFVVCSPLVEKKKTKGGMNFERTEVKNVDSSDKPPPVVEVGGNSSFNSACVKENVGPKRRQLRNRVVVDENCREGEDGAFVALKKNLMQECSRKRRNAEVSDENNVLAGKCGSSEPGKLLRRSKRNLSKAKDSVLLSEQLEKGKKIGRNIESPVQVAGTASAADSKMGHEVGLKSVVPQNGKVRSDGALVEDDNRMPSKNSVSEAVSEIDAEVKVFKQNEVSQPNGLSRSRRSNTSIFKSTASTAGNMGTHENVGGNEPLMQLTESLLEKEANVADMHLRRSRRTASSHTSLSKSTGMDGVVYAARKKEPRKWSQKPTPEEVTSVTESEPVIDKPPKRSTRNAPKHDQVVPLGVTGKAVARKKQQRGSEMPIIEAEAPLTEIFLALEEPPIIDANLSVPEAAGRSNSPVLSQSKEVPEDVNEGKKGCRRKSPVNMRHMSMEPCPETVELMEEKDSRTISLERNPAHKCVKLVSASADQESQIFVSESLVATELENLLIGHEEECMLQDNMGNEDDQACRSQHRRGDFNYNNVVEIEPLEQQHKSSNVLASEIISPDKDFFTVNQSDYVGKSAFMLEWEKAMETEEKPSGKPINTRMGSMLDHPAKDDSTLVCNEKALVEFEEPKWAAEPAIHESVAEDLVSKSNESEGSKKNFEYAPEGAIEIGELDISNGKGILHILKEREIDEVESEAPKVWETSSASHVTTAKFAVEKVTEIQFATAAFSSSDKLVNSSGCILRLENDAQEQEGNQPEAQFTVQSIMPGRSNPNNVEGKVFSSCKDNVEGKVFSSYEAGIRGGAMCRGETFVGNAGDGMHSQERAEEVMTAEENEHEDLAKEINHGASKENPWVNGSVVPLLDKLNGQYSKDKEASYTINEDMPSSKTPSKYNELKLEEYLLRDLFATPANKTNPIEKQETSDHKTRTVDGAMFENETLVGHPGAGEFSREKSQEAVKIKEIEHEGIACSVSASPIVGRDITDEGFQGNLDVGISGADSSFCPNLAGFFPEDGLVAVDDVSEDVKINCVKAIEEDKEMDMVELSVEAEIIPITSDEGDHDKAEKFKDPPQKHEVSAEAHVLTADAPADNGTKIKHARISQCYGVTTPLEKEKATSLAKQFDYENQMDVTREGIETEYLPQSASNEFLHGKEGKSATVKNSFEEVLSQPAFEYHSAAKRETLEVTFDNCGGKDPEELMEQTSPKLVLEKLYNYDKEVEESNCTVDIVVHVAHSKSNLVNNDNVDGEGIQREANVEHINHVFMEENVEVSQEIELRDGNGCQEVLAEVNCNADSSLAMTVEKISEVSGVARGTTECVKRIEIQGEENGGKMAPVGPAGTDHVVLDCGYEIGKMNASAVDTSTEVKPDEASEDISADVAIEKLISPTAANFECKDGQDFLKEVKRRCMLKVDDLISLDIVDYKDEVQELDKDDFIPSEESISTDGEAADIKIMGTTEGKLKFADNNSDSMATIVGTSPHITVEDFGDCLEEEEFKKALSGDHGNHICEDSVVPVHNTYAMAATKRMDMLMEVENARTLPPICSMGPGLVVLDHKDEFEKMNTRALGALDRTICVDGEDTEEIPDRVAGAMLQHDDLRFSNLDARKEEVDSELNKGATITSDEVIYMDSEPADGKGNVGTVEGNFSVRYNNFDAKKEDGNASLHVTPEDFGDQLVEEEVLDTNDGDRDVIMDHVCENSRVEADAAIAVTLDERDVSENSNGGTNSVEQAPVSPHRFSSDCNWDLQNSAEVKLLGDTSHSKHEMCSISLLNVLSSHGKGAYVESLAEQLKNKDIGEAINLSEGVSKPNSRMANQSPALIDSAADKCITADDDQMLRLKFETPWNKNHDAKTDYNHFSARKLNSSMMRSKNNKTKFIQSMPVRRIKTLDMKENTPSIKRQQKRNITAVKTKKRRALQDLQIN